MDFRIAFGSLAFAAAASAQVTSVALSSYTLVETVDLPAATLAEASEVAYDWDNGHLYCAGDNGVAVVELSVSGVPISTMLLAGFDDTEGLTYIGGGQFVIAEERLETVYRFTYAAGTTLNRNTLQSATLGPVVGNIGIEGVSYEPRTGLYFAVKEKDPERIVQASIDFPGGAAVVTDLFNPSLLGLDDFSDLMVLSTVPSLIGTADQDNLLVLSQASARLVKCSRTGVVLGSLDLSALSTTAEGVTMDPRGYLYICDETPRMFVFRPPCYANCDHSTTAPVLNANDFACFLNAFAQGQSRANCDGSTTAPVLNANDFSCFLNAFAGGCP